MTFLRSTPINAPTNLLRDLRFPSSVGRRPPIPTLSCKCTTERAGHDPNWEGTGPSRRLLFNHNSCSDTMFPILVGMVPVNLLECKIRLSRFVMPPHSEGMVPVNKLLSRRRRSSRVASNKEGSFHVRMPTHHVPQNCRYHWTYSWSCFCPTI